MEKISLFPEKIRYFRPLSLIICMEETGLHKYSGKPGIPLKMIPVNPKITVYMPLT